MSRGFNGVADVQRLEQRMWKDIHGTASVNFEIYLCFFCGPTCNWANALSDESETLEKALNVSIKYS